MVVNNFTGVLAVFFWIQYVLNMVYLNLGPTNWHFQSYVISEK